MSKVKHSTLRKTRNANAGHTKDGYWHGYPIQSVRLAEIKPYENNPRKNDAAVPAVVASIKAVGFINPIVIDSDNTIINGHTRRLAALKLGMERVPCIRPTDLSPKQIKLLRLADNKTSELSDWDFDKLDLELDGIADDFELGDFGFNALFEEQADGKTDADAVTDTNEPTVSKRGEVYQLGDHRLMCGDSTSAEDLARLMGREKADIAFTSPPYNAGGVAFADGDMFKRAKKKAYSEGYQDSLSSEDYISFASSVLGACFDNCARFIFWNVSYNANSRSEYIAQIVPFLSRLIEQVAWKKTSAVPLRGSMRRAWEPIYVFSVNGEGLPVGEVVTNIWEVSNTGAQSKDHKACFPVALPEKGIDASAARSVLDPFCGTGTTIIAAEKKGIRAFGMEIDPHYCDVIRRRWAEFVHGEGCDWKSLTPIIQKGEAK